MSFRCNGCSLLNIITYLIDSSTTSNTTILIQIVNSVRPVMISIYNYLAYVHLWYILWIHYKSNCIDVYRTIYIMLINDDNTLFMHGSSITTITSLEVIYVTIEMVRTWMYSMLSRVTVCSLRTICHHVHGFLHLSLCVWDITVHV